MPLDGAAEDIEVDASLSFLNGFVQQALSSGAQLYSPPDTPEVEAAPVEAPLVGLWVVQPVAYFVRTRLLSHHPFFYG